MTLRRIATVVTATVCAPRANMLAAQQPAAATITAPDIMRHIGVLAHDSMAGRDTPSAGLEQTAQYVADQFRQLGLTPGGNNGTWVQRYRIPGQQFLIQESSYLRFSTLLLDRDGRRLLTAKGDTLTQSATVSFATAARLVFPLAPGPDLPPLTVLIAGRHTARSIRQAALRGKGVLYTPPPAADSAERQQVIAELAALTPALVIVSDEDSATFARHLAAAGRQPLLDTETQDRSAFPPLAVYVRAAAVRDILTAAGVDLARSQAETAPAVRELAPITVRPKTKRTVASDSATAPNVVGILEGADPKLKTQYVVLSAHMDGAGLRPGHADSIANGAHDNASGVAGLIALAQAFSRPGMRPRRSVIFLAPSGGRKGQWGSRFFRNRFTGLPGNWGGGFAANVNLDMLGRGAGDTVLIDGLREVELATPVGWVVGAHPEVGVSVAAGGSVFQPESDHYAFAERPLPSLSFRTGAHADAPLADTPEAIDPEQVARIVRFAFYVLQDIGNADRAPRLTAEGRRMVAERSRSW